MDGREWEAWAMEVMEDEGITYTGNRGHDIGRHIVHLRLQIPVKCHQCGDIVPADELPLAYCSRCKED